MQLVAFRGQIPLGAAFRSANLPQPVAVGVGMVFLVVEGALGFLVWV